MTYDICQADETPVQVLKEPGRENKQKSYMWVYRGGPPDKRAILFDYQETRAGIHARTFLANFRGYLQTDGYKGYDWVDDTQGITHLGCMAHARRPFAELVKLTKNPGKATQAMVFFNKLYKIEDYAREHHLTAELRYQYRQEKALPILKELRKWLDASINKFSPKGKLGKGIQYMLTRWDELTNYLKDGRLEIDNNLIENAIRPFALGKKNWMFKGSPRGAHAGAILYSLIETAKANNIDPFAYLKYIFNQLPYCKEDHELQALLPWNIDPVLI